MCVGQGELREIRDGAGELDAGRAAPDDDKCEPGAPALRIGFSLGMLERQQDPAPDRGRVLQRLQSGSMGFPLVVSEIRMPRAGGHRERVIAQGAPVLEEHDAALRVDRAHRSEKRRDFAAPAHQLANRPGDFRSCERCCADLIQQRLKEVMIAPVHDGDPHGRPGQRRRDTQPAEAGAEDHDVMQ
jgi:hypothetical protein